MALFKLASSSKITGDFPPNSRVTFFSVSVAALLIAFPVTAEPVKLILLTKGCSTNACPASAPRPLTTLITPAGMPASTASSANRRVARGVTSEGFITIVQPVANAGAIFHIAIIKGTFQGTIAPTTPTGSRLV